MTSKWLVHKTGVQVKENATIRVYFLLCSPLPPGLREEGGIIKEKSKYPGVCAGELPLPL